MALKISLFSLCGAWDADGIAELPVLTGMAVGAVLEDVAFRAYSSWGAACARCLRCDDSSRAGPEPLAAPRDSLCRLGESVPVSWAGVAPEVGMADRREFEPGVGALGAAACWSWRFEDVRTGATGAA